MEKIIVTIPTFNRTQYLESAIDSVLREQARDDDLKLVVVDNCSTNPEMLVMLSKIERAGVRVIRNGVHGGFMDNWNRCLQVADGDWIHLLHDDDMVVPGLYRRAREIIGAAAGTKLGMIAFGAQLIDETGSVTGDIPVRTKPGLRKDLAEELAYRNLICNPAVIFSKAAAETVGGFGGEFPDYCCDWNFWFKIAQQFEVFIAEEKLAKYRVHSNNLQKTYEISITACARVADMQCTAVYGTAKWPVRPHEFVAAYGRGRVMANLRSRQWRRALSMAIECVRIHPYPVNIIKTVTKLVLAPAYAVHLPTK